MSAIQAASKWTFPRVALGVLMLAGAFALWNMYPSYSTANAALAPFACRDTRMRKAALGTDCVS